jgi:hypothetical protein
MAEIETKPCRNHRVGFRANDTELAAIEKVAQQYGYGQPSAMVRAATLALIAKLTGKPMQIGGK